MGCTSFGDPFTYGTSSVHKKSFWSCVCTALAMLAAMVTTAISVARYVYKGPNSSSSSSNSSSSRSSSSRSSNRSSSRSSSNSSTSAKFSIETVRKSPYGRNIAALMGVLSSSLASMQAVTYARYCFMANHDSLLLSAKPLEELLEPLDLRTLRNNYWDLAAL